MDDLNDKYKKKNPFAVPEGYFDALESQIMDRVEQEKHPEKMNFVRIVKPYLGMAVIFLFAIFVVQWVLPHFVDENKMLLKEGDNIVKTDENSLREIELDEDFNPTQEEIIEYLAQEVDMGKYFFDGIRLSN
ncbi:hypothetical protein [uncultured Sanguibacteroides sp.]|uniref:hypothetical protein n=1 Tax=uncultured Sanguibacteroides sp. TaxID=1635151 RepID=UPI0025E86866|nr:hypothetical protein [uncultured Sanguibacteroides sp.]